MGAPTALFFVLLAFERSVVASEADGLASQHDLLRFFEELKARVDSLQDDNRSLRQQMQQMQIESGALHQRVDSLQSRLDRALAANATRGPPSPTIRATVDESGRRLTSSSTFIAVTSPQIHEFPSGHSCSNTGFVESHPTLLGIDSSGPSLRGRKNLASADVSLASVDAKDFTISEIQRIAAPLKVVHDASCSSAPTLALQLDTTVSSLTVANTLMLGSLNVATELASASSASASSCPSTHDTAGWVNMQMRSDQTVTSVDPPRYKIQCGVVYWAGHSTAATPGWWWQGGIVAHGAPTLETAGGWGHLQVMGFATGDAVYTGGLPTGCTAHIVLRADGYIQYSTEASVCKLNKVSLYGISYQKVVAA